MAQSLVQVGNFGDRPISIPNQTESIRIGIVGATGYTAQELLRFLLRHPRVTLTRATSRTDAGQDLTSLHPAFRNQIDLKLTEFDVNDFAKNVDCAFCCLPHAASSAVVKQLVEVGVKTIDFSADYRLNDLASFQTIYQAEHADPNRLGHVPYGIPELFREQIRAADLVANPGCFPTTSILALSPLIQADLIATEGIIVDSKTGISGGGRTPKLAFHFPECNESVTAYSVGTHRHGPEMEQLVQRFTGRAIEVLFVPHLIPMDRGILSTIYVTPTPGSNAQRMADRLRAFYAQEPFVRVTDALPATKNVSGTNFCDLTVRAAGSKVVIVSAIDNLVKGASGAAVQNMNLMFGFEETLSLL